MRDADVIVVGARFCRRHARGAAVGRRLAPGAADRSRAATPRPARCPPTSAISFRRPISIRDYFWPGLTHQLSQGTKRLLRPCSRRVMGGGSSVMGMIALRGLPYRL